jgi:hypothetical protein
MHRRVRCWSRDTYRADPSRPVKETTLDGIALGQHEDEVLLSKGKPTDPYDRDSVFGMTYQTTSSSPLTIIWFSSDAKVTRVAGIPLPRAERIGTSGLIWKCAVTMQSVRHRNRFRIDKL